MVPIFSRKELQFSGVTVQKLGSAEKKKKKKKKRRKKKEARIQKTMREAKAYR